MLDPNELQDPEHKKLARAINSLRDEISMNGYGEILREVARRALWRQNIWKALASPRRWVARVIWIAVGAIILVFVENNFHAIIHP